jgi:hypothetical protein
MARDLEAGNPRHDAGDADHWANVGTRIQLGDAARSSGHMVDGKLLSGPIQGFGKMWQKTYRARLTGVSVGPAEIISTWKSRFAEYWPHGNRFNAPLTGLKPGEVALIDISLGPGAKLSTGVLVLYADDESFTLMTPQGHVFSGWITFSSFLDEGVTIAQTQILMRAADPICELGLAFGGHSREDAFWKRTLGNLGATFGAVDAEITMSSVCVDARRQWSRAGNIWQNGAVRTSIYRTTAPVRWIARLPARTGKRR